MKTDLRASTAIELTLAADGAAGKGAPTRIHVMPLGTWHGADGRGPYRNDAANAARVVAASAAGQRPLPIDYDHALDLALGQKAGQPAPASGWIVGLEVVDDGTPKAGIWASVEWTPSGQTAVASREYRFISPVFDVAKDGTVLRIVRAGLTNVPNFPSLVALASQTTNNGDDPMDENMKKLASMLGLADTATPDEVMAAVKALQDSATAAAAATKTAASALGLKEDAGLAVVAAAIAPALATAKAEGAKTQAPQTQATEAGTDQPTIASLNATVATLNKEVTELKAGKAAESAETAVAAAMAAGKIVPGAKLWALGYAKNDPTGFAEYVKAMPAIVTPGTDTPAMAAQTDATGLTAVELAVASQLGMTPAEFLKGKPKA